MKRYVWLSLLICLSGCNSESDTTTQNRVVIGPTVANETVAPTPDTRVTAAPLMVPTPIPTPTLSYNISMTAPELVNRFGDKIINATTTSELQETRTSVVDVNIRFLKQAQDLRGRGLTLEATVGPDIASNAMNQLVSAIDSKKSALEGESGAKDTYEKQCKMQIQSAFTTAQKTRSTMVVEMSSSEEDVLSKNRSPERIKKMHGDLKAQGITDNETPH